MTSQLEYQSPVENSGEAARPQAAHQYLTFHVHEEEFGIDILQVQEIKGLSRITPIPNTPPHIQGVINLRGTVVPVLDLRAKLGLPQAEYNQFTVIVIVNIGERVVGLVVDGVSDVVEFSASEVDPAAELGVDVDDSFIAGIAKPNGRLITLLDLNELVGPSGSAFHDSNQ